MGNIVFAVLCNILAIASCIGLLIMSAIKMSAMNAPKSGFEITMLSCVAILIITNVGVALLGQKERWKRLIGFCIAMISPVLAFYLFLM